MARLLSCIEIKIQLALFKNIDLRCEGLYRIRVGVGAGAGEPSAQKEGGKEFGATHGQLGTPFQLNFHAFPLESTVNDRKVEDSLCLHFPASVSEDEASFRSSTFLVRYIDETFLSGDEVSFRFHVDTLNPPPSVLLTLVLEMASVKESVEWSGMELEDLMARTKVWKLTPESVGKDGPIFTDLIRKELTLHSYAKGMNEYVPVLFDDCLSSGFGLLEVLVHSACVGFTFETTGKDVELTLEDYLWQVFHKGEQGPSETDLLLSDPEHTGVVLFLENIRKLIVGPGVCTHNCLKSFLVFVDDTLIDPLEERVEELPLTVPSRLYDVQQETFAVGGEQKKGRSPVKPTFAHFCRMMFIEATSVYKKVLELWQKLLLRISGYTLMLKQGMKSRWKERAKDRAGESMVRYRCSEEEIVHVDEAKVLKHHSATAMALRRAKQFSHWEKLPVEDQGMFVDKSCYPIIFEQHYLPVVREVDTVLVEGTGEQGKNRRISAGPSHAVVLVHGFMGSSWDLRSFRNYLSLLESGCVFLLSRVNEENTDMSIRVLAENLAAEMKQFLDTCCRKYDIKRVSVIGHSLGSVIARAALRHAALNKYREKMYSFFSLASPHLGTMGSKSYVVSTGMWLVSKWRKSKSLEELALLDGEDHRKSLLYELAQGDILHQFKHVVLISGHQDQYVPYHSARIQVPNEVRNSKSVKAQVQREMAEKILEHIRPSALTRVDFSFYFDRSVKSSSGVADSRLDTLIGRAAHVKVLDSPVLIMTLLLHYHDRFFSS